MRTVRILSGWSNPGGSTVAFINLTNLFNGAGIDTTFYGPHDWHMGKCKSEKTQNLQIADGEDSLIAHFIPLKEERTPLRRVIFSSHETNLFPLKDYCLAAADMVHFVSEKQRGWHGIDHPSVVIPNVVSVGKRRGNHKRGYVGVIGSIDSHKQTALAVESALISEPKSTKVLIFGNVTNKEYYQEHLKPILRSSRVQIVGKYDDKTKMYNMIDAAYHASKYETYGYIKHECAVHGIPFNDLFGSSSHSEYWPEDRILEAWKKCLEL